MTPAQNTSNASHASTITLAIDIGGSGIKGLLLNQSGQPLSERVRMVTPKPATPKAIVRLISDIAKTLGRFDRISVGFPGVIHQGRVKTAPNLDASWPGTDLVGELEQYLHKPVRAANDADVQGYGAIKGQGVEMVITLGTGFGTALFINGHLVPNLEIAHHPFRKQETYEVQLGASALKNVGKKRWNLRLAKAIDILDRVMNFDHLYIGGGNGKKVTIPLPPHATIVSNTAGLLGGIALWADPNVVIPSKPKVPGEGNARKQAPRKKSSKTLRKKKN
ncbi:ROK family protein [Candidatus Nitrospira neomarina]|uniref:ROK family protein n=1 Tax=Candidatus Nitrospira neomarina TaxID=3020899 RepID=A0AA96GE46_9BACT|nr:ROK family protein [Candidatus Nitrospira neomarina]WNM60489.1 ROK family protein [Candidatus Nitrospira neomarina]